jgi:hypothetical protein
MDDDALLQMAIEQSLRHEDEPSSNTDDNHSLQQMTLYEALGHPGGRAIRPASNDRFVDYDLQR